MHVVRALVSDPWGWRPRSFPVSRQNVFVSTKPLHREMQHLVERLNDILNKAGPEGTEVREQLLHTTFVEPFSWVTDAVVQMFSKGMITMEEYYELRSGYMERNAMLSLYEMNTDFGEWAERHVLEVAQSVKAGSKEYDPDFDGEYDLWLEGVKIEVKASRAVKEKERGPLRTRALPYGSMETYVMNFQHLRPQYCDVFVWVAVWQNTITYWVLASHEVRRHPLYSNRQSRDNKKEGQVRVRNTNIQEFEGFFLDDSSELESKILEAYERELAHRQEAVARRERRASFSRV